MRGFVEPSSRSDFFGPEGGEVANCCACETGYDPDDINEHGVCCDCWEVECDVCVECRKVFPADELNADGYCDDCDPNETE